MWKMLVGFIVFAVLAVYLLMKGGADVDMGGEKHGIDAKTWIVVRDGTKLSNSDRGRNTCRSWMHLGYAIQKMDRYLLNQFSLFFMQFIL